MYDHTCTHCGQPYTSPRRTHTKYCSKTCRDRAWHNATKHDPARKAAVAAAVIRHRAQQTTATCTHCRKPFRTSAARPNDYCSPTCRSGGAYTTPPPRSDEPWTPEEDAHLAHLYRNGTDIPTIMNTLGRSRASIQNRVRRRRLRR